MVFSSNFNSAFTVFVILWRNFIFSELKFPHLWNEDNNSCLATLISVIGKIKWKNVFYNILWTGNSLHKTLWHLIFMTYILLSKHALWYYLRMLFFFFSSRFFSPWRWYCFCHRPSAFLKTSQASRYLLSEWVNAFWVNKFSSHMVVCEKKCCFW